jgi:hypothetical protein
MHFWRQSYYLLLICTPGSWPDGLRLLYAMKQFVQPPVWGGGPPEQAKNPACLTFSMITPRFYLTESGTKFIFTRARFIANNLDFNLFRF